MTSSEGKLEQYGCDVYDDPRPAGYTTNSRLHFGGIAVHTLIDSGATANVISEEVAELLLGFIQSRVREGVLSENASNFPLISVEKYLNAGSMAGITAAGGSISSEHSLVLKAEFVAEGKEPGDNNPIHVISFKVLPKGTSTVQGCLLGTPVLDACPFGLGWRMTPTTHFFEKYNVHLPRLEAAARTTYKQDLLTWDDVPARSSTDPPKIKVKRSGSRRKDSINHMREIEHTNYARDVASRAVEYSRRSKSTRAVYDDTGAGTFELHPGDAALVPGVWLGEIPRKDFLCVPYDPRVPKD